MTPHFTRYRQRLTCIMLLAVIYIATLPGGNVGAQVDSPPAPRPPVPPQATYMVYLPAVYGGSESKVTPPDPPPDPPPENLPITPIISSFTASPSSIIPGDLVTLSWVVSDTTSLVIEPDIGAVTGSSVVVTPTGTMTYTLVATNDDLEARATVAVSVATVTASGSVASFIEREKQITSQSIAVDAAGGTHLAYRYAVPTAQSSNVVYSYCPGPASGCSDLKQWQRVSLIKPVDQVQLALTSDGHPRLLVRGGVSNSTHKRFSYGECDDNCFSASAWHFTEVAVTAPDGDDDLSASDLPLHFFALDAQDRPRFAFFNNDGFASAGRSYTRGGYYAQCDADCTNERNWAVGLFTHTQSSDQGDLSEKVAFPALMFTSQGAPRIVAQLTPLPNANETQGLYYFGCDSGCDSDANWGRVKIAERGSGTHAIWDLALDSTDRPQIAYYEEPDAASASNNRLHYLTCASACLLGENWGSLDLGLPAGTGAGVDLALDRRGRPRMAFVNAEHNLQYAWCNTTCADAASWQQTTIETSNQLATEFPMPTLPGCTGGFWGTSAAMLALDLLGDPFIAYRGTFQEQCAAPNPSDPSAPPELRFETIWQTIRVTVFPQP